MHEVIRVTQAFTADLVVDSLSALLLLFYYFKDGIVFVLHLEAPLSFCRVMLLVLVRFAMPARADNEVHGVTRVAQAFRADLVGPSPALLQMQLHSKSRIVFTLFLLGGVARTLQG